jgi:tRNA-specific 2-thiouridylase
VLVAMSGGVDSSVAAALLLEAGHEVVGATMRLWGGQGDSGCCSVADVLDARRVADELGIEHFVFDFSEAFEERVVGPYASEHAAGRTPNPCVECNRHLKFGRLLSRARRLGFDAVATGHHARVTREQGRARLRRGVDARKDQSYVLAVLSASQLEDLLLPVGELTKDAVRAKAHALGLRTAAKPDSQDVCFLSRKGQPGDRASFLSSRLELHKAAVVERSGVVVGTTPALELVTVGQRRGLGPIKGATGDRRYVLEVDVARRRVVVGDKAALATTFVPLGAWTWTGSPRPLGQRVLVQASAHGACKPGRLAKGGVRLDDPMRAVAPGQLVALYEGDEVVGSGVAMAARDGRSAEEGR